MEFKAFSNKIDEWDQKVIIKYNGIGGKPATYILKFFSFFGRETIWIFLIAFYLFIWYDPFLLANLAGIFLTGLLLIAAIKQFVNRSRPFDKIEKDKLKVLETKPRSKSFPSWHSYNIVAYGLLVGGFFLKSPMMIILMSILAIIISFSRIQLGVHYPSDVIFGCLIGIVGFFVSVFIVAPVFEIIFKYFEQFVVYTIEYRQLNSMIYENVWYLILWIVICVVIFLSATYKNIKDNSTGKKKI
ncbi:MAG: phosphatase PAP2 family protein [Candidatus Hodarchaeota archaeon]